jgi:membrane protein implicated in regulation of membrane protease activity
MTWMTAFGLLALAFMMLMYSLEHRGPRFVLAFAAGCALSSVYGFVSGAWPFGVVEAIWTAIAIRRWMRGRRQEREARDRRILDARAKALNREVEDVLQYQAER